MLTHWSYVILALTHRYDVAWNAKEREGIIELLGVWLYFISCSPHADMIQQHPLWHVSKIFTIKTTQVTCNWKIGTLHRARQIPVSDSPGLVKLPVVQVDLEKFFSKSYIFCIEKCKILEVGQVKIYGYVEARLLCCIITSWQKTLSTLLTLCVSNPSVNVGISGLPAQRPVMPNFDISFVVSLNELLNKQAMLMIWDAIVVMWCHCFVCCIMMTSQNGNTFHITGPLWGWPVDSPHKGQWRGALMFSLISVSTNGWANNRDAGDLRSHHAHYNITVMCNISKNESFKKSEECAKQAMQLWGMFTWDNWSKKIFNWKLASEPRFFFLTVFQWLSEENQCRVQCRCKAVQFITILPSALRWQQ